jgi:IS1 family transposase
VEPREHVRFAKSVPESAGDVRTWTAIDADSKLIIFWHIGDRSQHTGISFRGMWAGLRKASRMPAIYWSKWRWGKRSLAVRAFVHD